MSLDSLKNTWKQVSDELVKKQSLDKEQVRSLLKNRANDAVGKACKNLFLETFMGIILVALTILLLLFSVRDLGYVKLLVVSFVSVYIFISLVLMITRYKQLKKESLIVDSLNEGLMFKIKILGSFVKIYWIVSIMAFPIGFCAGMVIASDNLLLQGQNFIIVAVVGAIAFFLFIPLLRWYIRKVYKSHLNELIKCQEELNTEPMKEEQNDH